MPPLQHLRRRIQRVLWGAWLCVAALVGSAWAGEDMIRERAVLEDAGGQLTFSQARAAHFEPFGPLLARGYTASVFWLRIVVVPQHAGQGVRLRIRPTFVDEVQLHAPDARAPGGWVVRTTGDRTPFAASERGYNTLGFDVHPQAGGTTYYLRLKTSSSAVLSVEALTPAQAHGKNARLLLLQIAYLTLIGWAMLWSLGSFLRERNAIYGWFTLYQGSNILYTLLITGLVAALEPEGLPGGVDRLTQLSVIATIFLGLIFHRAVLRQYRPARVWTLLLNVPYGALLGVLLLYFSGHVRQALQWSNLLILAQSLVFIGITLTLRQAPAFMPGLRLLRAIYIIPFVLITLTILPFLGWIEAAEWRLQANLLHGLVATALIVHLLQQQRNLRRQHLRAEQQRVSRIQNELEFQKAQAQEQQQFIDMLTHEIKTPLSVARMSIGALKIEHPHAQRAERALMNINSIVDRTRLSNLAEHRALTIAVAPCDLTALLHACIEASTQAQRVKVSVGQRREVRSDSQLLAIILNNLIDNALMYATPRSDVQVSLEAAPPEGVMLRVRNTTSHAQAFDPQQVFSKYYRGPNAQGKSGSGLGLYLSRSLAQQLGGCLTCSVAEHTVEFQLWLSA